ncbi:putative nuclease of putative toxin-antitoxin system [Neorhizobium huautlense]|uniref:Nuclease of putative toxin-antitoxin system n=1 Tax=Neorhizobium huautlense TaxID=67774 RepID=A0ABT9PYW3_9HYPH|nr:DUF5615 family PIN-like protein [Neorhizobium huautlense]MDP9839632.1 putative nuclease of putative toxin-antitoxin system [Neorhizobium huautlense]
MRFLVDAQLPPALARWIVEQGHEARHVADCDLQSASDRQIWDYAVQNAAAIITKDEDFAQRRALTEMGPVVVWIRLPNARRKELLAWFEKAMPAILTALENDDTLIEVT